MLFSHSLDGPEYLPDVSHLFEIGKWKLPQIPKIYHALFF